MVAHELLSGDSNCVSLFEKKAEFLIYIFNNIYLTNKYIIYVKIIFNLRDF